MRPEFLHVKYSLVPSPAKISENPKRFGWKCRKYQNWKQVHVGDHDKDILRTFADSLIEEGRFETRLYGRISEILERVQRWRYDRENLAIEPARSEKWEWLQFLLSAGDESAAAIKSDLQDRRFYSDGLSGASLYERFAVVHLLELFGLQQQFQRSELCELFTLCVEEKLPVLRRVSTLFNEAYGAVGLEPPSSSDLGQLLNLVCDDVGIAHLPEISLETLASFQTSAPDGLTVVEFSQLDRTKLVSAKFSKGVTIVSVNENHPFVSGLDEAQRSCMERFFHGYGQALRSMSSRSETIDDFASYLGLALARY